MLNKDKYEEYIESLLNAARLTTKENSILISFKVIDDACLNTVEFIQQDGTKDTLMNATFISDDYFYQFFLEKFLISYYNNMVVAFNDSIDLNADGKYTYRVITDDNDMLSIDGITLDYANHLNEIVKEKTETIEVDEAEEVDESGNVSFWLTLFLAVTIGAVLLLQVLLMS